MACSIDIGEVWANILHNVYAALVGKYGFSATAKTNPDGTEGNIVYLHLFIDALKLQPCNPTSMFIPHYSIRRTSLTHCVSSSGHRTRRMDPG